jgi:hypothetical protein
MKCLGATAVCLAVVYGIDAIWFHGWYFASLNYVISGIHEQWR